MLFARFIDGHLQALLCLMDYCKSTKFNNHLALIIAKVFGIGHLLICKSILKSPPSLVRLLYVVELARCINVTHDISFDLDCQINETWKID